MESPSGGAEHGLQGVTASSDATRHPAGGALPGGGPRPSAGHALGLSGGDESGAAGPFLAQSAAPPLQRAPRPPDDLEAGVRARVDQAFEDFLNGDYLPLPLRPPARPGWPGEAASGPGAAPNEAE